MGGTKEFSELQHGQKQFLQLWLEEDEQLLNTGTAVSVAIAEQFGRGQGEGVLGLTNKRFLFRVEAPPEPAYAGHLMPLQGVGRVHSRNIILPGMRTLIIEAAPHPLTAYGAALGIPSN